MPKMIFHLVLILIVFNNHESRADVVEIEQGKLMGTTGVDKDGNTFFSFTSIPYAQPPVGNLRFADPRDPLPWKGVLNATRDVPKCPQFFDNAMIGQEDCLYLNVYTPDYKLRGCGTDLKPVLVFIHGGSFTEGSATKDWYGPEFLMPADVVLVTPNYRLGLLGFLNSPDAGLNIPGNAALKDQTKALEWIKKNIEKFGGDPDLVTLMGESSGGVAAHAHMFSKLSRDLFHRVIAMSSSLGNQFGRGVRNSLMPVGRRLKVNSTQPKEVLRRLRSLPFEDIVRANPYLVAPIHIPVETSPILETPHPSAFFTTEPTLQIQANSYNQVPLMIGYTNNEGLYTQVLSYLTSGKPYTVENLADFIPYNLLANASEIENLKKELNDFYLVNPRNNLDLEHNSEMDRVNKLVTDSVFISGIGEIMRSQAAEPNAMSPVYFYVFGSDTDMNYFKKLANQTANIPGAAHVDDMGYLFKNILSPVITPGSVEDLSVKNFVNLITTFARKGYPPKSSHWKPYSWKKQNYLLIEGPNSYPGINPDKKSFNFWKCIYDRYQPKPNFIQN